MSWLPRPFHRKGDVGTPVVHSLDVITPSGEQESNLGDTSKKRKMAKVEEAEVYGDGGVSKAPRAGTEVCERGHERLQLLEIGEKNVIVGSSEECKGSVYGGMPSQKTGSPAATNVKMSTEAYPQAEKSSLYQPRWITGARGESTPALLLGMCAPPNEVQISTACREAAPQLPISTPNRSITTPIQAYSTLSPISGSSLTTPSSSKLGTDVVPPASTCTTHPVAPATPSLFGLVLNAGTNTTSGSPATTNLSEDLKGVNLVQAKAQDRPSPAAAESVVTISNNAGDNLGAATSFAPVLQSEAAVVVCETQAGGASIVCEKKEAEAAQPPANLPVPPKPARLRKIDAERKLEISECQRREALREAATATGAKIAAELSEQQARMRCMEAERQITLAGEKALAAERLRKDMEDRLRYAEARCLHQVEKVDEERALKMGALANSVKSEQLAALYCERAQVAARDKEAAENRERLAMERMAAAESRASTAELQAAVTTAVGLEKERSAGERLAAALERNKQAEGEKQAAVVKAADMSKEAAIAIERFNIVKERVTDMVASAVAKEKSASQEREKVLVQERVRLEESCARLEQEAKVARESADAANERAANFEARAVEAQKTLSEVRERCSALEARLATLKSPKPVTPTSTASSSARSTSAAARTVPASNDTGRKMVPKVVTGSPAAATQRRGRSRCVETVVKNEPV